MSSLPAQSDPMNLPARLSSRGDLTSFLMQLSDEIGADAYMLLAIVHDQDRNLARIVASNWIHDAIELAGHSLIAALALAPAAAQLGTRPRSILAAAAPALPELGGEEAKLLDVLGHREIFPLRLAVGSRRYFLLLSSAEAGKIAADTLTGVQFKCCYALSQVPGLLAAAVMLNPLTDRERECLSWVSEGKTTDEVALILGVSSNTVNSYLTHAIQKLAASNRAMAIAIAIRSGIIEKGRGQGSSAGAFQPAKKPVRRVFDRFGDAPHGDDSRRGQALPLDRRRSQRQRLRGILRQPLGRARAAGAVLRFQLSGDI